MEVKFGFFSKMVTTSWKITKKRKKTYEVKFCCMQKKKLYSFEEEASHKKSENCTPPPISANICQNEQNFFCREYHQIGLQSAKL